jgi:hypothetical protein
MRGPNRTAALRLAVDDLGRSLRQLELQSLLR